jgi:hypothetical protein
MKGSMVINLPCRDMVFYESWQAILQALVHGHTWMSQTHPGAQFGIASVKRPHVAHARNKMIDEALKSGFEWILWLDDDAVPPPDLIERLMSHKKKWVAPLFVTRGPKRESPAAVLVKDVLRPIAFHKGGLMLAHTTGLHCMLMHRDVVLSTKEHLDGKALFVFGERAPWSGTMMTEDVWFCMHSTAAGNRLWIDCDTEVGHVTASVLKMKDCNLTKNGPPKTRIITPEDLAS